MWREEKLKDICEVFADGDWIETKDQSEDGIRLIQTGNIKTGNFSDRIDKARFINEDTFKRLSCTEIFEGDLLVSRLPDPVGRACLIPELKDRAITAVDCTIIRLKDIMLPEFACYYMQSPTYFSEVDKLVTGATRQRISRKNLGEILFPIPPLADQQRIVAKLDAAFAEIDEAIGLAEAKTAEIKQLQTALLSKSLSEEAVLWKTVKLGEICNVRRGTTITKKNTVDGAVPVIGGGTKPTYFHNEANRNAGCITVSGSGARAGFVNYWDTPIFASDCSTVEIKTDEFLQQFVYYFMQSQQQFIYENFRSGAAQPHVYAKEIATLDFPVITLAEQQRIVAKLDAAFAEIETANNTIRRKQTNYQALKSAILAQELQSEAA